MDSFDDFSVIRTKWKIQDSRSLFILIRDVKGRRDHG